MNPLLVYLSSSISSAHVYILMIDAEGISMKFYVGRFYGIQWKSFTLYFVTWAGRPHLCSLLMRSLLNIYMGARNVSDRKWRQEKNIYFITTNIFRKFFDFKDDDRKMTALYLRFPLWRTYGTIQNCFLNEKSETFFWRKREACRESIYELIKYYFLHSFSALL
jgi:uncharacterized membrane protein YhfC